VHQLRFDQYLSLLLLSLVILLPTKQILPQVEAFPAVELVEINPIPVLDIDQRPTSFIASISAQSISVIDVDSASILLENNSHQKVAPASTTKLLTALVARDIYKLDEVISIKTPPLHIGHTIGFRVGEEFLVEDILKALLINSGNDAAEILAQNHPEGRDGFILEMNNTARRLYLTDSSFMNPSGLDAAAHFSSAFDLSLLAREIMKDDFLRAVVGTEQATIANRAGTNQYWFYNTNLLLGVEPGVVGLKTGTTDLAGEALITQVDREGRKVLIVILGSKDRYSDTKKIIDWIFSHYQWLNF
jgi:serine-type D-Ala-D-Ala carboxypeptidase (penicillin-binding protein 5/6)